MAARVLVFEPRASVLGRVSEMLRRTGTETTDCYSEAKFRHTIKQHGDLEPLIVCPERFVAVVREASPGGKVIPYESDQDFVEANGDASRRLVQEVGRVSRRRGRRRDRRPLELLVLGASTGGFPVVQEILRGVSPTETIIVVAQHIGPGMTEELSRIVCSTAEVAVVRSRTRLKPGNVYLLAGGKDYEFVAQGTSGLLIKNAPEAGYHYHPSITHLLRSLAELQSVQRAAAIILSGLGDDGAASLRAVQDAGVVTLVQDPTCAKAPSMPVAAVATGAVSHVYPVAKLHEFVNRRVK